MLTIVKDKTKLAHLCADYRETAWSELYNTEQDLINDLKGININNNKFKSLKGQDYIISFQKQITAGKTLSEKQISMLKRISKQIAKYYIL